MTNLVISIMIIVCAIFLLILLTLGVLLLANKKNTSQELGGEYPHEKYQPSLKDLLRHGAALKGDFSQKMEFFLLHIKDSNINSGMAGKFY